MDATQTKFEGWAVVEIFGHIKEVGFVTTEYFGAAALFRIDTPELPMREYALERPEWHGAEMLPIGSIVIREAFPGRTRLVGPSAIFSLIPTDEASARKMVDQMYLRPLKVVSVPDRKQIAGVKADDQDRKDEEGF